jgi:hypothetical protein
MNKFASKLFVALTLVLFSLNFTGIGVDTSYAKVSFGSSSKPYVYIPKSYSKPSYSAPSYSKPSYSSPTYSKPSYTAPSYPKSSSGYSKPTFGGSDSVLIPKSTSGYSKPGGSNTSSGTSYSSNSGSALGNASKKSMSYSSLQAFKSERDGYTKVPTKKPDPVSVNNDTTYKSVRSQYSNVDDYMSHRTVVYNTYYNRYPLLSTYGHSMYPYYGVYDNSFLLGMMFGYMGNSLDNAAWFYAHQNDPWYGQWRSDMNTLATQNVELAAKLEALDLQINNMKIASMSGQTTSVAAMQNSLPPGVDASIAIAPEAMIAGDNTDNDTDISWWWFLLIIPLGLVGAFYIFND